MKKSKNKILAWILSGAMVLSTMPINAFATEIDHTNKSEVTQVTFDEKIATQEFTKGEENAEVNLPETISAQVTEITWAEVEIVEEIPPSEDVETVGEIDTSTEDITDGEAVPQGENVAEKTVTPSNTPITEWQSTTEVKTLDLAVTWAETENKEFSTNEVATFVYTSTFVDTTYTFADGVEMPKITVNVVEEVVEEENNEIPQTPLVPATPIEPQADGALADGVDGVLPVSDEGVQVGAFTVTGGVQGTDYDYANNTLTIKTRTALEIANTNPATPTTDKIVVDTGIANITLSGVNINLEYSDDSAFEVTGLKTTIILAKGSTNRLISGFKKAGLQLGKVTYITIDGTGLLTATGGVRGAGIGGGDGGNFNLITINGGTINASGRGGGAGIGGGNGGGGDVNYGGIITINGGTINASGGVGGGAGIGDGNGGAGSTFSTGINGSAVIYASSNGTDISDDDDTSDWSAIIFKGSGNVYGDVYGNPTISQDFTIAENTTLTVGAGKTLTLDGTLRNNGTLIVNGAITGDGTIAGNGTFNANIFTADDISGVADAVYTGEEITITPTVSDTRTILCKEFTIDTTGWTPTIEKQGDGDTWTSSTVQDAGTYRVKYTKAGKTDVTKEFTVSKSGTSFGDTGVKTYKGDETTETTTFTYGDTITVKVTPQATGVAPVAQAPMMARASFAEPTLNQMALFIGGTQISEAVAADGSGMYAMSVFANSTNEFVIGSNIITAKYVGNDNMADHSESVEITLNEAPFTVTSGVQGEDFTYVDGVLTITGTATVQNTNPAKPTTDRIVANDGANVTLNGVNIFLRSDNVICAFEVLGTVNITLNGTNKLESGENKAGLHVEAGNSVTINGTGSLTAIGGNYAAGIGGGKDGDGGTIKISGGTVTAKGGNSAAGIGGGGNSAAGIGGGENGASGTIEISGGTVTATGDGGGAGIGGGENGASGTIEISGGTVTATGKGGGAGIGGGKYGSGGTFSTGTDGTAFIKASSISDKSNQNEWKGIIFEGGTGTVYGNQTLSNNLTIASSESLTINVGSKLTVDSVLTNEGTLTNNGNLVGTGTLTGGGTFKVDVFTANAIADIPDQVYTGSAITPTVTISPVFMDISFTLNTEGWTKSFENHTNVGTATVKYTKDSETVIKTFNITPKPLAEAMVSDISSQTYIGSAIEPTVTVTDSGVTPTKTLVKDTDYTVAYSNKTDVGTANITITGDGNYKGTVSKNFTITKANQTALTITSTSATYGTDLILAVSGGSGDGAVAYAVTNGTGSATIANGVLTPTGVGNVTVTATKAGDNNYNAVSSVATTITIGKADLTVSNITIDDKVYDGTTTATVTGVTFNGLANGETLAIGTDYTVTNATFDNAKVGTNKAVTATITLSDTAKANNYNLTNGADYSSDTGEITGIVITEDMITVDTADKTYTKSAIEPVVTVKNGATSLTKGTDYTVTYTNNTNVGTATITITGKGNYSGRFEKNFEITAKALTEAMITVDVTDKTYTGSAIEPTVTVADGSPSIITSSDYTVTYTKNTNVGEATVTITGIGNYGGEVTKTFEITKADQDTLTVTSTNATYGTDLTLSVTGGSGDGAVSYTVTNGTGSATIANGVLTPTGVGNVTVTATKAGDNNYNEVSSVATTITIGKATQTGTAQELSVVKNLAKSYTFDLSKMLPTLSSGQSFGDVSYSVGSVTNVNNVLATEPTTANISSGILTLSVANVSEANKTATVNIAITSDNYTFASDVVLTVKTVDKTPVTITATMTSRTYDGNPLVYTGTPTFKNGTDDTAVTGIDYTVKYEGRDGTTYTQSETAPINAGKYNLVLAVDDTSDYTGTASIGFEIEKANPSYTVPTGLTATYGDTLASITLPTGFTFQDEDTTLVGNDGDNTFKVTFTPTDEANYNTINDINVVVKVVKKVQTLTFNNDDVTAEVGDTSVTEPTLSGDMTAVEYSSGNPSVATVNATTGDVTIVGVGTSIIKATAKETEEYSLATATYTVTVNAGEISLVQNAVTKFDVKYSDLKDVILTIGSTDYTLTRSGNDLISTTLYPFNGGKIGTAVEGSVVVTLYKEFLSTLPKGTAYSVAITTEAGGGTSGEKVTGTTPATKDSYTLTITGGGTDATASGTHEMGSIVNINAGTKAGYTFNGWTGAIFENGSNAITKMLMPSANTEITANWTAKDTGGSGGSSGGGGGSRPTPKYDVDVKFGTGDGEYKAGEWVTITAEVREGKTFSHWVSDEVTFEDKNASTTRFKMNSKDVTVTAVYVGEHINPQTSVRFEDIKSSDWYYEYILDVVDKGLFSGTSETTFSPNANATRAMVWTVLARMADVDVTGGEMWYSKAQKWAMENEVSDGTNPNDFITREQFVAMLYRFEGSPKVDGMLNFADTDKVSDYAYNALVWAVDEKIITGKGENTLDPQGNLTRAEMATILSRFTQK